MLQKVVRGIGLEPTRLLTASGPKPGASTNFAIPARRHLIVHEIAPDLFRLRLEFKENFAQRFLNV